MLRSLSVPIVLVCCLAAAARAEEDARSINERAEAAYALGRFGDAAVLYEKVFELKPQPALLYNAAQAHRLAGNKERAVVLYQSYLRVYGSKITNREEVESHIAALQHAIETDTKASTALPLTTAAPKPIPQEPKPEPAPPTAEPAHVPPAAATNPAVTPPSSEGEQPLTRRPLFWALVGVGAVVVIAAVVLGVVLSGGDKDPTPSSGVFVFGGM